MDKYQLINYSPSNYVCFWRFFLWRFSLSQTVSPVPDGVIFRVEICACTLFCKFLAFGQKNKKLSNYLVFWGPRSVLFMQYFSFNHFRMFFNFFALFFILTKKKRTHTQCDGCPCMGAAPPSLVGHLGDRQWVKVLFPTLGSQP